ncbi:unnamed protein product [Dicrocoelium dendriticum]|nr:unnamed protein product [Dicrocoelium dendriticum]
MRQVFMGGFSAVSSLSANLVAVSDLLETCGVASGEIIVRWFHKCSGDKRWTPFSGYDSLNLESRHRSFCAELPPVLLSASCPSDLGSDTPTRKFCSPKPNFSDRVIVSVKGGLYDVDIRNRLCLPVYWTGKPMRVLRGTWFRESTSGSLEPLDDESMVDQLETDYSKFFLCSTANGTVSSLFDVAGRRSWNDKTRGTSRKRPHITLQNVNAPVLTGGRITRTTECVASLFTDDARQPPFYQAHAVGTSNVDVKRRNPVHTVRFADCHVDFFGPAEIYLYYDSTALYIRQKLGMQKVGTRLYRGYNQVANPDDKPPDVTHLCFVIHGIGQKMGSNSILRCVNGLRESCAKLQSKYFTSPEYATQRLEFLPVEWRSSLQLDGDTVDSITPTHVRGLRTTLNYSAMDIMYYTSPLYRAEISSGLLAELNRLYTIFCTRDPHFESRGGKVSIIAHSLGCVLMYDLITGWSQPLHSPQVNGLGTIDGHDCSDQRLNGLAMANPHANITATPSMNHHQCNPPRSTSLVNSSVAGVNATAVDNETSDVANELTDLPPEFLQKLAHVSLKLEVARTEVSQLEQELSHLRRLRPHVCLKDGESGNKRIHANSGAPTHPSLECSYFTSNALPFKDNLQSFFCLGSPLSVFLALRGIRPGNHITQDNILPRRLCPRIFNIYHPADPVAYRLEPLVLKHYSFVQPSIIHRADAASKPDYDDLPLVTISGREIPRRRQPDPVPGGPLSPHRFLQKHCTNTSTLIPRCNSSEASRVSLTSLVLGFFSRSAVDAEPTSLQPAEQSKHTIASRADSADSVLNGASSGNFFDPPQASPQPKSNDFGRSRSLTESATEISEINIPSGEQLIHEDSPQLEHRLDYQLRASRYENWYLSVLTSHTSYWYNADVGMLILSQLLGPAASK